jgi:predicted ATPase
MIRWFVDSALAQHRSVTSPWSLCLDVTLGHRPRALHRGLQLLLVRAARTDVANAEECFGQALECARRQDALSWELRSATSLARLYHRQGRTTQARKVLAPVYRRFTEGFKTADLLAANALLDALR